ncbi:MAG: aldose epimerase family protein [Verrucomicrobiota bacterium]
MPPIEIESFGNLPDGREVSRFTLSNSNGMVVRLINYGGIVQEIHTPDTSGNPADVVLGEPDLAGYLDHHPHYGAITGRYANRIRDAEFALDGHTYHLPKNKFNKYCLHGGFKGFDKKLWSAATMNDGADSLVQLSYTSPDGEEGFPGKLETMVSYRLTSGNELRIEYTAQSDRTTVINLTNHSYFNLGGPESHSIKDHEVCIRAPFFVPTDEDDIPTGEILAVDGTDFDLRKSVPVGERLASDHPQILRVGGFDHSFLFGQRSHDRDWDCRVVHPGSGRTMEVLTSEPAVQLYTANTLGDTTLPGKNGEKPRNHQALCLETQHLANSPNEPHFPSTVLKPGDTFRSFTVYRFGVEN